jgi:glycine/D-amino acid oxidase-like deaminating enzyme
MAETADLIVVGGGIVGCAVVQHCAELLPAGARIVLLDRGPVAGATSGPSINRGAGGQALTPPRQRPGG